MSYCCDIYCNYEKTAVVEFNSFEDAHSFVESLCKTVDNGTFAKLRNERYKVDGQIIEGLDNVIETIVQERSDEIRQEFDDYLDCTNPTPHITVCNMDFYPSEILFECCEDKYWDEVSAYENKVRTVIEGRITCGLKTNIIYGIKVEIMED